MNLSAKVLEYLNDFEIIGYGSHFVFQNNTNFFSQAKHLQARTFHSLSLHSEAIAPIIREK